MNEMKKKGKEIERKRKKGERKRETAREHQRDPDLHGEGPPGHRDHGAVVEVSGELGAVHRGAHQDDPQVGTPQHHVSQDGQQEVRLHAALVHLGAKRHISRCRTDGTTSHSFIVCSLYRR